MFEKKKSELLEDFKLTGNINSDQIGFLSLIHFCNKIHKTKSLKINIDMSGLNFIDANLCSVIGAILFEKKEKGHFIYFSNIPPKIRDILSRNLFLYHFSDDMYIEDGRKSTVKFRVFRPNQSIDFKNHIEKGLFGHKDILSMTPAAKKYLLVNFCEVFGNCVGHSNSSFITACGQFFSQKKRVNFTIVDCGVGIYQNVINYLNMDLAHHETINWAMKLKNSTRPDDEVGGLGLHILREFLKLNEGTLQIISGAGYWSEEKSVNFATDLSDKFPGTIINMSLNLNDLKVYFLAGEEVNNFDNIF
jgi:hypothetical protein